MASYYPVYIKTNHLKCLIVGAGNAAAHKVAGLLSHSIKPVILAPEACEKMQLLIQENNLVWHKKAFETGDTTGFNMIFAATPSAEINQLVRLDVSENALFDDISGLTESNFIVPASIKRGALHITVSTSGEAPFLTHKLQKHFNDILPESTEIQINSIVAKRKKVVLQSANNEEVKKQRLENEVEPLIREFLNTIGK